MTRRWRWQLTVIGIVVLLTCAGVMAILFLLLDSQNPQLKLDVIKVGLASGAGVGALITLLLATRRQLLAEQSAEDVKFDARERRVVDLFIKGLERFGADKEEIRVGGLYALERLADAEPSVREQVVDVVCTFLRTHARTRRETDPTGSLAEACQKVLIDHLAHDSTFAYHKSYWEVGLVSLSGAVLHDTYFAAARVDTAHFSGTVFAGEASFDGAVIRGANYSRAEFRGPSSFVGAWLGKGIFANARFRDTADFRETSFWIEVDFTDAFFKKNPLLAGARVAVTDNDQRIVLPPGWQLSPDTVESDGFRWRKIEPMSDADEDASN